MVGPVVTSRAHLGRTKPHIRYRWGRWYAFTRQGRGWCRSGSGSTPGAAYRHWRGHLAVMVNPLHGTQRLRAHVIHVVG